MNTVFLLDLLFEHVIINMIIFLVLHSHGYKEQIRRISPK